MRRKPDPELTQTIDRALLRLGDSARLEPSVPYGDLLTTLFSSMAGLVSPELGDGQAARAVIDPEAVRERPEILGLIYQACQGFRLDHDRRLVRCAERRKGGGVFYTPPFIAQKLLKALNRPGTVCDPACGTGFLLLEAVRRLQVLGIDPKTAVENHIFGVDLDPTAVLLCRASLMALTGRSDAPNIKCADSLTADWNVLFPTAKFDLVVGNPPFGNVIEGRVPDELKQTRTKRFPSLGGTADLAYYFLALGAELASPGGKVAMVQPRAFRSATSTRTLRKVGAHGLRPVSIEEEIDPGHFEGAAVYVAVVTLACPKSSDLSHEGDLRFTAYDLPSPFKVQASMTTAEAYDARPFISEGSGDRRLITTGLIAPGTSLWGERRCRFLKHSFDRPYISCSEAMPATLQRRLAQAARPKILVAGLSAKLEAFLDEEGEYQGGVSTYAIFHENDDTVALDALLKGLLSHEATDSFRARLGPSALGGGSITLTKAFLKELVANHQS